MSTSNIQEMLARYRTGSVEARAEVCEHFRGAAAQLDLIRFVFRSTEKTAEQEFEAAREILLTIGPETIDPILSETAGGRYSFRFYDVLGRMPRSAVPRLIRGVEDQNRHVVRASSIALGRIGDRRAVEPLLAVLKRVLSDPGPSDHRMLARKACPSHSCQIRCVTVTLP